MPTRCAHSIRRQPAVRQAERRFSCFDTETHPPSRNGSKARWCITAGEHLQRKHETHVCLCPDSPVLHQSDQICRSLLSQGDNRWLETLTKTPPDELVRYPHTTKQYQVTSNHNTGRLDHPPLSPCTTILHFQNSNSSNKTCSRANADEKRKNTATNSL